MHIAYKEYLTYMNKLYVDGLVDPESFTMSSPAYQAKTTTLEPVAGVISIYAASFANDAIPGNDPTKSGVYQHVSPLKGNNGVEPVWLLAQTALNGNIGFVVSAKTKHGEELCRWIDMQYDQLVSLQARYGKIGVHIKDEGNNKFSVMKKSDGSSYNQVEKSASTPVKYGVAFIYPEQFEIIKDKNVQNEKAADEIYSPYLAKEYHDVSIMKTSEEAEELSYITSDLLLYVNQMTADFITKGNIDARWNDYLANLKKLKLEKYLEIYEGIGAHGK